jgi:hypothetical protein
MNGRETNARLFTGNRYMKIPPRATDIEISGFIYF